MSDSYQQVNLLTPLQTSIRFIPMVIAGLFTNVMGGWMMNWLPGQPLMLGGIVGNLVRKFFSYASFRVLLSSLEVAPMIFALIDIHASYWIMSFWVMIFICEAEDLNYLQQFVLRRVYLIAGADIVYPVGTLQISAAFDEDSQSLAGGIFNVATRVSR